MELLQPKFIMSNTTIEGELQMGENLRKVTLVGSTIGLFDARGKQLTYEFLEGAKFKKLEADATTQVFNRAGTDISKEVTVQKHGDYFVFAKITP